MTSSSAHQQAAAMQSAVLREAPTPLSQIRSPRISYPRAHGQCPATAGLARLPDLRDDSPPISHPSVSKAFQQHNLLDDFPYTSHPSVCRAIRWHSPPLDSLFSRKRFYPSFPDRGGSWCGSSLSVIADQQCSGRLAVCGEAPIYQTAVPVKTAQVSSVASPVARAPSAAPVAPTQPAPVIAAPAPQPVAPARTTPPVAQAPSTAPATPAAAAPAAQPPAAQPPAAQPPAAQPPAAQPPAAQPPAAQPPAAQPPAAQPPAAQPPAAQPPAAQPPAAQPPAAQPPAAQPPAAQPAEPATEQRDHPPPRSLRRQPLRSRPRRPRQTARPSLPNRRRRRTRTGQPRRTPIPRTVPGSSGTSAPNTTTTPTAPSTPWSACSRFKPGHYVHIADDNTRNLNGLAVLRYLLSKDVRNFKGVAYQMPWGMLEKSPGCL